MFAGTRAETARTNSRERGFIGLCDDDFCFHSFDEPGIDLIGRFGLFEGLLCASGAFIDAKRETLEFQRTETKKLERARLRLNRPQDTYINYWMGIVGLTKTMLRFRFNGATGRNSGVDALLAPVSAMQDPTVYISSLTPATTLMLPPPVKGTFTSTVVLTLSASLTSVTSMA